MQTLELTIEQEQTLRNAFKAKPLDVKLNPIFTIKLLLENIKDLQLFEAKSLVDIMTLFVATDGRVRPANQIREVVTFAQKTLGEPRYRLEYQDTYTGDWQPSISFPGEYTEQEALANKAKHDTRSPHEKFRLVPKPPEPVKPQLYRIEVKDAPGYTPATFTDWQPSGTYYTIYSFEEADRNVLQGNECPTLQYRKVPA